MRNIKIAKNKLDHVIEKIGDNKVSMSTLCRHLNREFRSLSVRFRSKQGKYFSLSGNYAGDIQQDGDRRYNVDITYEKKTKKFYPVYSPIFFNDVLKVLVHEFRHGYQEKRRGKILQPWQKHPKFKHELKDIEEEVNYLSDYDEIDAYAYEVAYVFKTVGEKTSNSKWIVNRYRNLAKYAPKLYNRFLKKVYKYAINNESIGELCGGIRQQGISIRAKDQ